MNAENFSNYLKNPAQLYQLSYQELKSLVIQYPYCQNLRHLLLQKSLLENRKDFDRNLQMAAAYSIDREFLYQQLKGGSILKDLDQNNLELKDFSTQGDKQERVLPSLTAEGHDLENFIINLEDFPKAVESESPLEEDLPESKDVDDLSLLESLSVDEELELGVSDEEENATESLEDLAPKVREEADSSSDRITNLDDLLEKDEKGGREKAQPSMEDSIIDSVLSEMGHLQVENKKEVALPEEKTSVLSLELMENLIAFGELLESFELSREALREWVVRKPQDVPLEITNEEGLALETENDFTHPEPKVAFSSWVEQFQLPKAGLHFGELGEVPGKAKTKKKKKRKKKKIPKHRDKKNKKAELIAQQSIVENAEIASEPLAALLESQGHYQKAIAMYERLSLLFPEKSIFFAAKIEQLKEL